MDKLEKGRIMETGSFGIGLGLGLALGVVLGVTLMLVFKNNENTANSGVMYTYDENNRLKSMVPVNENIQLVKLKEVK